MSSIANRVNKILDDAGINTAPVDVEELAKKFSIKVTYEDFDNSDDISGMLYREEDGPALIVINSTHPVNRKRFSIAHELGHYFLHTGELFVDRLERVNAKNKKTSKHFRNAKSSLAIDKKEIEANSFAANLLMPTPFIHKAISELLDRFDDITAEDVIKNLCQDFQVSQSAMSYRLENLGIIVRQ